MLCSRLLLFAVVVLVAACTQPNDNHGPIQTSDPARQLIIISGSENKGLEPIVQRYARQHGLQIDMHYKGSVDIMLELQRGADIVADAVWPANSLWITLGDHDKVVQHIESIMTSPVVFGVRRSVASQLGWLDRDIQIADVLAAAESGHLRFAMTSATQSNSGASAYMGFLHAMAGAPPVLTEEHLADEQVQQQTARLMKSIHRSSGSSGWLKELVLSKYDEFDAMVNYEALIIEANQVLERQGKEPLIAIYPTDGIMMADSPLGYVDRGESGREKLFQGLQDYLLSEPVQDEILALGRRTGLVGFAVDKVDPAVFNPAWGIDVRRVISAVPTPTEPVIRTALELYQVGGLRKPSATVYVLDYSGSMGGGGEMALKAAMQTLLDPAEAKRFLLQPSGEDRHIVVPFDGHPRDVWRMTGNDPRELAGLLRQIKSAKARGGTDIYAACAQAVEELRQIKDLDHYFPSIILMTDGQSKGDPGQLARALQDLAVPVFSIAFGNADDAQLKVIAETHGGRVFHGHRDLAKAFRKAKGYN